MRAYLRLATLLALATPVYAAAAPAELPFGLLNPTLLGARLRAPMQAKVQQIRQNLNARVSGATAEFLDGGVRVLSLTVTDSINPPATEKSESVQLVDSQGRVLWDETVTTRGTGLALSSRTERATFAAPPEYALEDNETSKQVTVLVDHKQLFAIRSDRRAPVAGAGDAIAVKYFVGRALAISTVEQSSTDGRQRSVSYQLPGFALEVCYFASCSRVPIPSAPDYQVVVQGGPGQILDEVRYFIGGTEHHRGLAEFLNLFGAAIDQPAFEKQLINSINQLIANYFPKTERQQNLNAESKFLTDLRDLKVRIEQARTNPAVLNQAASALSELITAVESGGLVVQDNRGN